MPGFVASACNTAGTCTDVQYTTGPYVQSMWGTGMQSTPGTDTIRYYLNNSLIATKTVREKAGSVTSPKLPLGFKVTHKDSFQVTWAGTGAAAGPYPKVSLG